MSLPGLHQIRRELAPVCPRLFLGLSGGRARGFWASGDRWVVHSGVLATVEVETDAPQSGGARFSEVQEQAARVFGASLATGERSRLFGGFSFSPRRNGDSVWSCFPPALFHLPEVELEHHPAAGACSLVARGEDREVAERTWERWAAALQGGAGSSSGRVGPGPALRLAESARAVRAVRPHDAAAKHSAGADLPAGTSRPAGTRHFTVARHSAGTERAAWGRMVWEALSTIGAGEAEKVVLARTLEVAPPRPVRPADLVVALWEENHGSHVFLFEPVPGQAIVGAAPETIATLVNGMFRATAVAGSVGVGADSVGTAQLARRLFNSEKDRAEHDFVVRDMVARLTALGCAVQRDVEPHVLALARIQHLETKIAAEVPGGISLLDILASLHPTPAVCGIPRNVALSVLEGSEPFDRGWYAGPVGWFDSHGKGIFVPALRSAVGSGERWRLFAGAGIVPGSDPALEWEETELKFRPVLRAIARAGAANSSVAGSG